MKLLFIGLGLVQAIQKTDSSTINQLLQKSKVPKKSSQDDEAQCYPSISKFFDTLDAAVNSYKGSTAFKDS